MDSINHDFSRDVFLDIVVQTVNVARGTASEAVEFKRILESEIDSGVKKLIVNLSDCLFIDSAFTGAIVVSLRKISTVGGDLRLTGLQSAVKNVLELTRVIRQFDVFPTVEDAIASYGGQGSSGLRENRLTIQ